MITSDTKHKINNKNIKIDLLKTMRILKSEKWRSNMGYIYFYRYVFKKKKFKNNKKHYFFLLNILIWHICFINMILKLNIALYLYQLKNVNNKNKICQELIIESA